MKVVWLILVLLLALVIVPAQAQIVTISGFDPRCISIDGNVTAVGDTPGCIDWLVKQTDGTLVGIYDGFGNADPSIFSPGSTFSSGSMLPKQDITNVYVSNNNNDMYLVEERRANNGNSKYHLFMTKLAPTAPGQTGIMAGQNVIYHLSNNDLEIQICFPRGSDPAGAEIGVFQVSGLTDTLSVQATDIWSSGAFKPVPSSAIDGFTVNISPTQALTGARDSKGNLSNTYDTACFAEAAISLGALNINPCGAKAFATVITRSSCSLTSDIKDFAGPVLYSFGGPTVTKPTTSVDCVNKGSLAASVDKGSAPYDVKWYDNDTLIRETTLAEPGTDSFDQQMTIGDHIIKVVVTDAGGCSASDLTDPPITINDLLGVKLSSSATCPGAVTLTATASGGDGSYTYVWTVDGNSVAGTTATLAYGPAADCKTHTVAVTVTDGHGCKSSTSTTVTQSVTTSIQ